MPDPQPDRSPIRASRRHRTSVARRARHIILAIISLGVAFGAAEAAADPYVNIVAPPAARTLRVVAVPVDPRATARADAIRFDLLAAAPNHHARAPRFPALPAVSVTGYNLAVLHRLRGDVAAKLTVGVEHRRPVPSEVLAPAVGIGLEYGF